MNDPQDEVLWIVIHGQSLEQFFLTVGQNNFGNKIPILSDYIYLIHPRRPFSLGQMNVIVIFFTINLTRTISNLVIKILHYISKAIHITRCNKDKK